MEVRRGDVWQADLGQAVGSEQGGVRPRYSDPERRWQ